jgi:hypothetical protein
LRPEGTTLQSSNPATETNKTLVPKVLREAFIVQDPTFGNRQQIVTPP